MGGKNVQKRARAKREALKAQRRRQEKIRKIRIGVGAMVAVAIVVLLFALFRGDDDTKPIASPSETPTTNVTCPATPGAYRGKTYPKAPPMIISTEKKYVVNMETSCGPVKFTLDPKLAPKAVNNFVFLAREGYYDNTKIHRIVDNPGGEAIMQAGDPKGDGTGGPGYQFTIEKPPGGPGYARGAVAMANSGGTASNGSQFFIVVREWAGLPHDYTLLGNVTEAASFDVLNKIVKLPGTPLQGGLGTGPNPPIYILKVTVTDVAA